MDTEPDQVATTCPRLARLPEGRDTQWQQVRRVSSLRSLTHTLLQGCAPAVPVCGLGESFLVRNCVHLKRINITEHALPSQNTNAMQIDRRSAFNSYWTT
jgi:hypothetical protein